jgi:hypothetical protein
MFKTAGYFATPAPFVGTTVVEIAILSGKLIAADDLRTTPYFKVEAPQSINYGAGTDAWARLYAEQAQVAYAFVGNSCPSITRQEDGSLVVVDPDFDDVIGQPVFASTETVVAEICTDLWAVMLADYEHWLRQGGPTVDALNSQYAIDNKFTVIDVTPGLYQWTVFSNDHGFDIHAAGRLEYARLELIQAY